MGEFFHVVIAGLSQGSLYGLLAVAIVLPWRVSNVASFAQGDVGMVAAFLAYFGGKYVGGGSGVAAVIAVVLGGLIGATSYLVLIAVTPRARLTEAGHINLTLRTFGLDVVLLAVAGIYWAANEPYPFPALASGRTIRFWGIETSPATLVVLGLSIVIVTCLHFTFSRTRFGLQLQAVAEDTAKAQLAGVNPTLVSVGAWTCAGALAALAAVLYTPFTYLTTGMMVSFLLKSFTAVLLGGRSSWFGVLLGGLFFGLIEAVAGNYISYLIQPAIAFVILTLVLVFRPNGVFARSTSARV